MRDELRAHTRTLNALRETQLEHGQRLDRLDGKVTGLDAKVDQLDAEMKHGFSMMSVGMAQITALLTPEQDSPGERS